MPLLSVQDVSKRFKDVIAVDRISFDVPEGKFISLLGPSGCGKTTTLRMIAGLETVSSGRIILEGKDVTHEPPFRRNTGMVFQNYALFPHMNVYDNIAFGLKMRNVKDSQINERVANVLELVHLSGFERRKPNQLSGGQQQRIALARALVIEPALLLLDEPLSNLDAKLREEMRIEIRLIQQQIGVTTVFVTHDQEEALTLSDTVIVMENGRIVEIGTPIDIYQQPRSEFTAEFIGHANLLYGEVTAVAGNTVEITSDGGIRIRALRQSETDIGDRVLVVIKQERIRLEKADQPLAEGGNFIPAKLKIMNFLGPNIHYICQAGPHEMQVRRPNV